MFEWKVEEMALMNERTKFFLGKERIFDCESETSREDKIAFVDSVTDGKLSYLLSLIKKFESEKESLPKDNYGNVKTVSLKSWIKRNDTKYERPIIDDWYHYGKYAILGVERYIQSNSKGHYETYDDLVDECFHRQLFDCKRKEEKYFAEHDEYSILRKEVREKSNQHGTTFGIHIVFCSSGQLLVADDNGNDREITLEELRELLTKYEQLDTLVEKLTAETHIVY